MDLTTTYLGLTLAHPFMPGASPLVDDLDMVRRLEDAGASAIVMHSLFAEQIARDHHGDPFPAATDYGLQPDEYLEQLVRIKRRVHVPVIASLNGTSPDTWLTYARLIERASADALELNFYYVPTDVAEDAGAVEHRVIDIVAVLKESVRIPLAVKLSPFYSALPNLALQLTRLGADGLVLFNRVPQAGIDAEAANTQTDLRLSDSSDLRLCLRALAVLFDRVQCSLAASGGVHRPIDAVNAVMAGADAVQIVSALLLHGPEHLGHIRREVERWGDEHGYATIADMRGLLSLARCPDPGASERAHYIRALQVWRLTPPAHH